MSLLQELKDKFAEQLFGMTVQEAWDKRICIQCGCPINKNNVYSEAGIQEYAISGLCEVCFNGITEAKAPPKSRDEVLKDGGKD